MGTGKFRWVDTADVRAEMWRDATVHTLEQSPISQADLARAIGRTQQQLSHWLLGRAGPPPPDTVFAIEDALGCVDQLSSILGYVRHKPTDVEDCVRRDDSLPDSAKRTLLELIQLYRRP